MPSFFRGGKDEMNIVLQKIKSVIGASNDLDKVSIILHEFLLIQRYPFLSHILSQIDTYTHIYYKYIYIRIPYLSQLFSSIMLLLMHVMSSLTLGCALKVGASLVFDLFYSQAMT